MVGAGAKIPSGAGAGSNVDEAVSFVCSFGASTAKKFNQAVRHADAGFFFRMHSST